MREVTIGARLLGDNRPVYVALEIGPTVTDLSSAIALVAATARASADAVKIQLIDADQLVADPDLTIGYTTAAGPQRGNLRAILRRRMLTPQEWGVVGGVARERGLDLIATVDGPANLALASAMGAAALKIMSGDVNHVDWVMEVARAGLPVMLDTGNATLGEVETAVDAILAAGNDRIVIHHVPSGYPAGPASVNLRVITTLRQMFPDCAIGFSDHGVTRDACVAAVALGVHMIEKVLTLDRAQDGPEHIMGLEPAEAGAFVQAIWDVEQAMGAPRRVIGDKERAGKVVARRSAHLRRGVVLHERLQPEDIDWRRPGDGIQPCEGPYLVGRKFARDLPAGHKLRWEDLA